MAILKWLFFFGKKDFKLLFYGKKDGNMKDYDSSYTYVNAIWGALSFVILLMLLRKMNINI